MDLLTKSKIRILLDFRIFVKISIDKITKNNLMKFMNILMFLIVISHIF